jgi:hypothetical protein
VSLGARAPAMSSGFPEVFLLRRVDFLLGFQQAVPDQELDGVGGVVEQERQFLLLDGAEVLEHEVGRVLPTGWPSHADPDTVVVLGAEGLADVAETVVPALSPAELQLEGVEWDVDLVVHCDHVVGRDVVEARERGDRSTREVHVRQGLGEDEPRPADAEPALERHRLGFRGREATAHAAGQQVQDHLADVVPVAAVAGPGVSEPGYKPGVSGHRLLAYFSSASVMTASASA